MMYKGLSKVCVSESVREAVEKLRLRMVRAQA